MRLALSEPARVSALCLADSAGLGREVNLALVAPTALGARELNVLWGKSPVGAARRALSRGPLLFANPLRAPGTWYREQYRAARSRGLMETALATLR